MSGFSSMKKNSQSAIDRLSKEMTKLNSSKSYEDDRFWTLQRDKAGNGYAVIRFLMAVEGEELPWVRLFSHGFQGKGGWFIENCPTTINGKKCPICEANNELWGSGLEANKTIARDRKRKLTYISNIYVVSDPSNRENEGKVFLFKYGKKIFDKLQEAMNPTTPDEAKFNPFDMWHGANFKLKAHIESGYVSYEKSGFQPQEALLADDKQREAIWTAQYPLQPFVAPDQFKSYEELKARFDQVLYGGAAAGSAPRAEEAEPNDFRSKVQKAGAAVMEDAPTKPVSKKPVAKPTGDDDEEDAFSYFKKLADED
jgi:hypothetical protein